MTAQLGLKPVLLLPDFHRLVVAVVGVMGVSAYGLHDGQIHEVSRRGVAHIVERVEFEASDSLPEVHVGCLAPGLGEV